MAADVCGVRLSGEPVRVAVRGASRWTLLLFLSSGCDGCRSLWSAVADPEHAGLAGLGGSRVVVVARDAAREDVAELRLRAGAVGAARVVLSSAAWEAYSVLGPPFFALVDGSSGRVASEGVAWSVEQVVSDVGRATRATLPLDAGEA